MNISHIQNLLCFFMLEYRNMIQRNKLHTQENKQDPASSPNGLTSIKNTFPELSMTMSKTKFLRVFSRAGIIDDSIKNRT